MARLADTLSFMEALTAARTGPEVQAVLFDLAGRYGFDSAFGGLLPPTGVEPTEVEDLMLIQQFPAGWAERYGGQGYLFRDPTYHRAMRPEFDEFTWADAFARGPSKADADLIAGEAAEFGLKEGVVIPVELLDKCKVIISFGGLQPSYGPDDIKALAFATSCTIGKLLLLRADRGVTSPLSRREHDCLSWAAEGKSDVSLVITQPML